MADQKVVPTGPQGAVRVSDDDKTPVRASGQNPDPRDNTPTAEQLQDRQNRLAQKNQDPNAPQRDSDGTLKYGGGGAKLRFERDYWPEHQPENKIDPQDIDPATGRPRVPLVHREHRIRAGEVASIPSGEADELLELGVAKRVKG
jgi:hypothetical protein